MTDQLVQVIQTLQLEVQVSRGQEADLKAVATHLSTMASTKDALALYYNHRAGPKPFKATNFKWQKEKTQEYYKQIAYLIKSS